MNMLLFIYSGVETIFKAFPKVKHYVSMLSIIINFNK